LEHVTLQSLISCHRYRRYTEHRRMEFPYHRHLPGRHEPRVGPSVRLPAPGIRPRSATSYTIGMLSRAMSCPESGERLWGATLRVLHCLSVHRHLGLRYCASDSTPAHGFSDSDWAVKHSTTGFTFQYANATISWGSKKQTSVASTRCCHDARKNIRGGPYDRRNE
jgi:hypothetical protein